MDDGVTRGREGSRVAIVNEESDDEKWESLYIYVDADVVTDQSFYCSVSTSILTYLPSGSFAALHLR